jgi:hypothetical protein
MIAGVSRDAPAERFFAIEKALSRRAGIAANPCSPISLADREPLPNHGRTTIIRFFPDSALEFGAAAGIVLSDNHE